MLSRRAFLGILGVAAAVPLAEIRTHTGYEPMGTWATSPEGLPEVAFHTDPLDNHGTAMTLAHATRFLHRRILKHLGPSYRITGTDGEFAIGSGAASRYFDKMVSGFVPELDHDKDRLKIDRVFLDDMAQGFAERIRASQIVATGMMQQVYGVIQCERVITKRLALRGVSVYDIVSNNVKARWDVLGAAEV